MPAEQLSVLVVDDEAIGRQFLTRWLESWGYLVRQADGAAEALALMTATPASVVLCNVKMPGPDGLQFLDRLHMRWPNTPVIVVAALEDLDTVAKSRDHGAVDCITKPIQPDQLHDILQRLTTAASTATVTSASATAPPAESQIPEGTKTEAEYILESPVRCPACGEKVRVFKAIRLIRSRVNFTSTLPRRGRVVACPHCLAVVPAELSNF